MNVGFKTGPKNWEEGKQIVLEDGAKLCEVWFRIDRASEYDSMLAWLKEQKVATGLHHWGLIEEKYKTNIASANADIRLPTIQQVKDTIDVGARIGCAYVNAHCGAQGTEQISFYPTTQQLLDEPLPEMSETVRIFLESAHELFAYAKERGVLLTIETLPAREMRQEHDRGNAYDPGNIPYTTLIRMGTKGGWIANDITHSGGQILLEQPTQEAAWDRLLEFTVTAAPFTKLLHINTLTPPLNGTDSHNGILEEDFALGAFPTKDQIASLLRVFRGRNDVFVIPEPKDNMRENYNALRDLAESVVSEKE